MDSAHNDVGELVFHNFSLVAKSVSCFKMFITAYHDVPTYQGIGDVWVRVFVCVLPTRICYHNSSRHEPQRVGKDQGKFY